MSRELQRLAGGSPASAETVGPTLAGMDGAIWAGTVGLAVGGAGGPQASLASSTVSTLIGRWEPSTTMKRRP